MDIEQIKLEIQRISNNSNLSYEEKMSRIQVYQTFIQSSFQEAKYNAQIFQFIHGACEMEYISGGSYQIADTLKYNKLALKGNILESDLVKDLEEKGIMDFTLSDLKTQYSALYELEHGVKIDETNKAIALYDQIETIEKTEQRQMEIISRNLGDLLGRDIVSNTIEKNTIQSDAKAKIELINKNEKQLQADYRKSIDKINELYINEGVLDLKTKQVALKMLNQLFSYYTSGNKKIPMDLVNQVEISNNNQRSYAEQGKKL